MQGECEEAVALGQSGSFKMIENFAEDEKRGFFSARSWNRTIVFFAWLVFFVALLGERIGAFAPFFYVWGVFGNCCECSASACLRGLDIGVCVRFRPFVSAAPFCVSTLLLFPMATVDVRVIGESSPGSIGGSGGGFGGGGRGGSGRGDGGRRDMDDEEDEEEDLSKFSRRKCKRCGKMECLRKGGCANPACAA